MSCCKDKKYYSELCEKCKIELAQAQKVESDYPYFPDQDIGWEAAGQSIKCECGSEKTGGPGHSGWCPKNKGETDE